MHTRVLLVYLSCNLQPATTNERMTPPHPATESPNTRINIHVAKRRLLVQFSESPRLFSRDTYLPTRANMEELSIPFITLVSQIPQRLRPPCPAKPRMVVENVPSPEWTSFNCGLTSVTYIRTQGRRGGGGCIRRNGAKWQKNDPKKPWPKFRAGATKIYAPYTCFLLWLLGIRSIERPKPNKLWCDQNMLFLSDAWSPGHRSTMGDIYRTVWGKTQWRGKCCLLVW